MAWTDKYLELGGAGTGDGSSGDPWTTFAECLSEIGAIAAPTRVYVKGTEVLGANINWNVAGSNANPLIFVGCDASWNVIGNDASATKPTVTCGAYTFDWTGGYCTLDNLAFTSSHTTVGGTMENTAGYVTWKRCRFTSTGASTNACAVRVSGGPAAFIGCYFNASTSATYAFNGSDPGAIVVFGCEIIGGISGVYFYGQLGGLIAHNIIRGMTTGSGIYVSITTPRVAILNNTIIGNVNANDGIQLSGAIPWAYVLNNLICGFSGAGSYPIYLDNATAPSACVIGFNAWYNCANDCIGGMVETQATHAGAALDFGNNVWNYGNTAPFDADPLPNAATLGAATDFDLAYAARALAFPGTFEAGAYAYQGYLDHGAVQRMETYPTVAQVEDDVTFGGLGATAGSNALTGEYPTTAATNAAHLAADKAYLNTHKDEMIAANDDIQTRFDCDEGTAAGGGGGGARIIGG